MIKDMLDLAISQERKKAVDRIAERARQQAEHEVLVLLKISDYSAANVQKLRGDLANEQVDVPLEVIRGGNKSSTGPISIGLMGDAPDELMGELSGLMQSLGNRLGDRDRSQGSSSRRKTQRVSVKEALRLYQDFFSSQMINEDDIINVAKEMTEQRGIVFIDEIGVCDSTCPVVLCSDVDHHLHVRPEI
jgi:ATP-dependent HslUV protease ATP-binding subunit HslU